MGPLQLFYMQMDRFGPEGITEKDESRKLFFLQPPILHDREVSLEQREYWRVLIKEARDGYTISQLLIFLFVKL